MPPPRASTNGPMEAGAIGHSELCTVVTASPRLRAVSGDVGRVAPSGNAAGDSR